MASLFKLNLLLVWFALGEKKNMRDFFPKIGTPAMRRTRKPVIELFPTAVYTDPQCLQIIKQCDKDANASYVKDFHKEIKETLSQK